MRNSTTSPTPVDLAEFVEARMERLRGAETLHGKGHRPDPRVSLETTDPHSHHVLTIRTEDDGQRTHRRQRTEATMIRPSICLEMIYEDEPFVDRIDRVADHGFDTVEFWTWPDKDLDAIEARLDDTGVSLAGMAANTETRRPEDLERGLTDPTKQAAVVADIESSIEVATRLDCPNLIVLVGPELAYTREEMYESVVDCLREVAPAAEAAGVTLIVEPLNTAVDHEGYFLERSSVGFDIVSEVGSPAVKINFDIYHQQISEGNITATVTSNVDKIGHVHVADVPGRHEPGTGELNYANILGALDEAGYDEYVGFEYSPASDDDRALTAIRELVTD